MSQPFKEILTNDLANLLTNSINHDVEIAVGKGPKKKVLKAHSAILCGRSTYFQAVLADKMPVEGKFFLEKPDIEPAILERILR
jgi:hypothetical protein